MRARRRGVLAPLDRVADVDVPQVDEVVHQLDELEASPSWRMPRSPSPTGRSSVSTRSAARSRSRRPSPRGPARAPRAEAGAVLERPSVLVGAVVEERQQELMQQRLRVRAVDDEDVEAGAARPLAGVDVQLLHLADVLLVHLLAGAHERERAADLRRAAAARGSPAAALGPPCQISTAASEPCSWSMSHIRLRFRTSPSSQSLALTRCVSSLSGAIEQYSVHTVPQPPSAFIARKWAWKPGRSEPAPLQCATWKKRLGRSSGRPRWARRGCRTSDRGPCARLCYRRFAGQVSPRRRRLRSRPCDGRVGESSRRCTRPRS